MRASDLLRPPSRFLRTANLERDFGRADALDAYVVTPFITDAVRRIAASLRPDSFQRAWRVTGDYGTGKSSFGLALARAFSGETKGLPLALNQAVEDVLGDAPRPRLLPVLLTGTREGLAPALARALDAARARLGTPVEEPGLFDGTDHDIVSLLGETLDAAAAHENWDGLFLAIDELGKFLEHAALHPGRADIHLLQTLAEAAARSGSAPFVLVGFLHQGFAAYADTLTRSAQQEWAKVAGRFSEILFDPPLEQTAELAARALGTDRAALPDAATEAAGAAMDEAVRLGWYGPGASAESLRETAAALYPLHPTALPALLRATRLYGQNERSLFSFLLSPELNGLREFAESHDVGAFFGLDALYDYVAATYGHRIAARSVRSHWTAISSLIDTYPGTEAELRVLKAVGLLNLLNTDRLLATPEALPAAFVGTAVDAAATAAALQARGVLFDRGARGGVCLWPHSSVDLEREYRTAAETLEPIGHVGRYLAHERETAPIVARRHYIETGALRHVEVRATTAERLLTDAERPTDSDALLLTVLCDIEPERTEATEAARTVTDPAVLVAIPPPLAGLRDALEETAAWRHVVRHTPALTHDAYAAEEASRQVEAAQQALARRLDSVLAFTKGDAAAHADWVRLGESVGLGGGRAVVSYVSDLCAEIFDRAPRIANELINREQPSSAAKTARMRLVGAILTQSHRPRLGLPADTFPPEKALYLSILQAGRLHRETGGAWGLHLPAEADDPTNLRPVLRAMRETLGDDLAKVPVPDLFAALKAPPYGVREGLLHLLLAIFLRLYEREVAMYEDGAFVRRVTPEHFQRLDKAPERFALQRCTVDGVRADVFAHLRRVVGEDGPSGGDLDVLGIVTPLCLFAAELPEYALATRTVSAPAQAVRETLLDAREPATLLFADLPEACGVPLLDAPEADPVAFAGALQTTLDELRAATPELRARVGARLAESFDLSTEAEGPAMDEATRRALSARASAVLGAVQDRDLKAFAGRLADSGLAMDRWLDSVAALVTAKPLERWTDDDEARFGAELDRRTAHFLRTEATVFGMEAGGDGSAALTTGSAPALGAVRVGVTEADGTEAMRVLVVREADRARLGDAVEQAEARFREMDRVELLAAVRALGRVLSDPAPDSAEADA
ncbi:MAG: hypothetical protein AAGI52_04405 [Bacteroidota bacterium]